MKPPAWASSPRAWALAGGAVAMAIAVAVFDPYLFTGECEQAKFGAVEKLPELAAVQRAEWETLLEYCWGKAVAP